MFYRKLKNLKEVVDWGLCTGCGLCYHVCSEKAIELRNFNSIGIRPVINEQLCNSDCECIRFCPGYSVDAEIMYDENTEVHNNVFLGPTIEIWEGYASDPEIRFSGSSGGVLTALSLYCLEKEDVKFVLHTGMDEKFPWKNIAVKSENREQLLMRTGSRYSPSSPCEGLELIEKSDKPCVFIGKPCDASSVMKLKKSKSDIEDKLALVLTFFCAGVPSSQGTIELINNLGFNTEQLKYLRYRGQGWPGDFKIILKNNEGGTFLTYFDSWHLLQKYRSQRCHLCPDGLGQIADISCGDAWHKYDGTKNNPGESLILVRTSKGKEILQRAVKAGYLTIGRSDALKVIKAQGLIKRRTELFGRLLARNLLFLPSTKFLGFELTESWNSLRYLKKVNVLLSSLYRILKRGLWHKNPLNKFSSEIRDNSD